MKRGLTPGSLGLGAGRDGGLDPWAWEWRAPVLRAHGSLSGLTGGAGGGAPAGNGAHGPGGFAAGGKVDFLHCG